MTKGIARNPSNINTHTFYRIWLWTCLLMSGLFEWFCCIRQRDTVIWNEVGLGQGRSNPRPPHLHSTRFGRADAAPAFLRPSLQRSAGQEEARSWSRQGERGPWEGDDWSWVYPFIFLSFSLLFQNWKLVRVGFEKATRLLQPRLCWRREFVLERGVCVFLLKKRDCVYLSVCVWNTALALCTFLELNLKIQNTPKAAVIKSCVAFSSQPWVKWEHIRNREKM